VTALLTIDDLRVALGGGDRPVHALRGVDLELPTGQATGLVGESGSGKTTTMLAILGLLPPNARILGGSIRLEDQELIGLPERHWRRVRGERIAAVFQNARAGLHPLIEVGEQLARVHRRHFESSRRLARANATAILAEVGFSNPTQIASRYPHQLSGGQCQRVMIGMALIAHPRLILADEPTSGLDVTVEQQILEMLVERVRDHGATLLLISHDIRVIKQTCDSVAVMYAGEVVESGGRGPVLEQPKHPYTQGLLAALDPAARRMPFVPGAPPDLRIPIVGCAFANRCAQASDDSRRARPEALRLPSGQLVRCVLYRDLGAEQVAVRRGAESC
jgi:oligopeptide/dipeptide ABC transporter ATP-binding protein